MNCIGAKEDRFLTQNPNKDAVFLLEMEVK